MSLVQFGCCYVADSLTLDKGEQETTLPAQEEMRAEATFSPIYLEFSVDMSALK